MGSFRDKENVIKVVLINYEYLIVGEKSYLESFKDINDLFEMKLFGNKM